MESLSAEALQARYGRELAAEPYASCRTPRQLYKALCLSPRGSIPPVHVTVAVCKQWIDKYCTPVGSVRLDTVEELEARYGAQVRRVLHLGTTAYTFWVSLRELQPALYVTEGVARAWLLQYAGQGAPHTVVRSAELLEQRFGQRLRDEASWSGCIGRASV